MTFPTSKAGKEEAFRLMQATAAELMADVAALRARFPGATMTYFQAGGLEYGKPSPEGWQIDQALLDRVAGPAQLTPAQLERNRKAKLGAARRKAKRR